MVEQHPIEMGAKAVEELGRIIETGAPAQPLTLIPTQLVIRASCGSAGPPAWDSDESHAFRRTIESTECVPSR